SPYTLKEGGAVSEGDPISSEAASQAVPGVFPFEVEIVQPRLGTVRPHPPASGPMGTEKCRRSLGYPDQEATVGFYSEVVFPRLCDLVLNRPFVARQRRTLLAS